MSPVLFGLLVATAYALIGFLTIWATETIYRRLHPRNTP